MVLRAKVGCGWRKATKERPMMVAEGDRAPDFALPSDTGDVVRLSALEGRIVVLYFYPKDDTSGCTREAQDFSTLKRDFEAAGADVIGVSPDSAASHKKFKSKHGLSVRLVADEAKFTAEAYGVWVEKSMYGRKYMGVERATFLIDRAGRVAKAWHKVKVDGHAGEVLAAVRDLKA
jgi:peroxiredoxin Q/BCP